MGKNSATHAIYPETCIHSSFGSFNNIRCFSGIFIWVFVQLPQITPLHFGFDGMANRFGDKSEQLWMVGIGAVLPIINAILTLKFGKYKRGLVLLLGTIFIISAAMFVYTTYTIVSAS